MNNQILKTACCMMMTRRTPLVGVRGAFLYAADETTIVDEKMSFVANSMLAGELLKVYNKGSVIDTIVKKGAIHIYNGGVVTNAQLLDLNFGSSIGKLYVHSGGVAQGIYVRTINQNNLQCMFVMSGGVANNCVTAGGVIVVESGGVVNNCESTTFSGGYTRIIKVEHGGTANNSIIDGTQEVYGVSNYSKIYNSLGEIVGSGGVSNSPTIFSGGELFLLPGASAFNVFCKSGGVVSNPDGGATITYRSQE